MMGRSGYLIACIALVLSSLADVSEAQMFDNCTSSLSPLQPCLNFVQQTETTLPQSCCTALRTVVSTDALCVCKLLDYALNYSVNGELFGQFNVTLAQQVPTLCTAQGEQVNADPSQCTTLITNSTSSSPTTSPAGTTPPSADSNAAVRMTPGTLLDLLQWAFPSIAASSLLLF